MAIIKTILYQFNMSDVEDPEIYAAQPIWEWQKTDYGQWCMEHCVETPSFIIGPSAYDYQYRCTVYGQLTEENYTFHQLRWSNYVGTNRK